MYVDGGRREGEKEGGTRDPNANFIELRRVIMSKCIFYCRLVSTRDVNYSRAAIFTSGFAVNAATPPDTPTIPTFDAENTVSLDE